MFNRSSVLLVLLLNVLTTISLLSCILSKPINSNIVFDTIWTETDSPYNVTANIIVKPGAILTIGKNVRVYLDCYKSITVLGGLIVNGTFSEPVEFSNMNPDCQWGRVALVAADRPSVLKEDGYFSGSIISQAVFRAGGRMSASITSETLKISDTSLLVTNTLILESSGNGINIESTISSNLTLKEITVQRCQGIGVVALMTSGTLQVLNSTISNNLNYGLDLSSGYVKVSKTKVTGNYGGISVKSSTSLIEFNEIVDNHAQNLANFVALKLDANILANRDNSTNNLVQGNLLRNNSIPLLDIRAVRFQENIIEQNTVISTNVSMRVTAGEFRNNTIQHNQVDSVLLQHEGYRGAFERNIFRLNIARAAGSVVRFEVAPSLFTKNILNNPSFDSELLTNLPVGAPTIEASGNYIVATSTSTVLFRTYDFLNDSNVNLINISPTYISDGPAAVSSGSVSPSGQAQTPLPVVSSQISTSTYVISGSYHVYDNMVLSKTATLLVLPGTHIAIDPGKSIYVEGSMAFAGTSAEKIRLTRSGTDGYWNSIVFGSTAAPGVYSEDGTLISGSGIQNTVFEYATTAVNIQCSSFTMQNVTMQNIATESVRQTGSVDLVIESSEFTGAKLSLLGQTGFSSNFTLRGNSFLEYTETPLILSYCTVPTTNMGGAMIESNYFGTSAVLWSGNTGCSVTLQYNLIVGGYGIDQVMPSSSYVSLVIHKNIFQDMKQFMKIERLSLVITNNTFENSIVTSSLNLMNLRYNNPFSMIGNIVRNNTGSVGADLITVLQDQASHLVMYNRFENNRVYTAYGVLSLSGIPNVSFNSFENPSSVFDILIRKGVDNIPVDLNKNWFGTTSETAIKGRIRDFFASCTLGWRYLDVVLVNSNLHQPVFKQIYDTRVIAQDTTWSGVMTLTNHVMISSNATLTIAPGTRVFIPAGKSIVAHGSLIINGEPNNRVVFNSVSGQWSSILFRSTSVGTSNSYINGSKIQSADFYNGGVAGCTLKSAIGFEAFGFLYVNDVNIYSSATSGFKTVRGTFLMRDTSIRNVADVAISTGGLGANIYNTTIVNSNQALFISGGTLNRVTLSDNQYAGELISSTLTMSSILRNGDGFKLTSSAITKSYFGYNNKSIITSSSNTISFHSNVIENNNCSGTTLIQIGSTASDFLNNTVRGNRCNTILAFSTGTVNCNTNKFENNTATGVITLNTKTATITRNIFNNPESAFELRNENKLAGATRVNATLNYWSSMLFDYYVHPQYDLTNISPYLTYANTGDLSRRNLGYNDYCSPTSEYNTTVGTCETCPPSNPINCNLYSCFDHSSTDPRVCTGYGTCVAIDQCLCQANTTGENCEFFKCFGIDNIAASVCSGHGACIAIDGCECSQEYTGTNCSLPVCFGKDQTNPLVCSGHGSCISPDSCICSQGHDGHDCRHPICFGTISTNSSVCSSFGNCTAPDNCLCTPGHFGDECQYAIECFGKNSVDPEVCSSHGVCNETDICTCNPGHAGSDCEQFVCFEHTSTSVEVCSGRGACVGPNNCTCNTNYFGHNCSFSTCNGTLGSNASVCSSRGQCIDFNTCECQPGYLGEVCELHSCFGLNQSDPAVCDFGRSGSCISKDNCTCLLDIVHGVCKRLECYGKNISNPTICSAHGNCVETDSCNCTVDYGGNECNVPKCGNILATDTYVCHQRGQCQSPNNCSCNTGYSGTDCQNILCFGVGHTSPDVCSGNGVCNAPDQCLCNSGNTGPNCHLKICYGKNSSDPQVCSSHGQCVEVNNCSCHQGFTGQDCLNPICYGNVATDASACSTHGVCSGPDHCECDINYTGAECDIPKCFTVSSADVNVCSSHGTCIAANNCSCNVGYVGAECQLSVCHGKNSSDPTACSGRGVCAHPENCVCRTFYSGDRCEIATCTGINGNDSSVCSGNGFCADINLCDCDQGYTGPNCNTPMCYGIAASDPSVCDNGLDGSCVDKDNCTCFADNVDGNCTVLTCYGKNLSDISICSGSGSCVNIDTCHCPATLGGNECELSRCNGILETDSSVCNSRGECFSPNNCSCHNGYRGTDCEISVCFGIEHTSAGVCSGNGACISADNCQCNAGFTGSVCQVPICYGLDASNTSVCSGKGNCSSPDNCHCSAGYFGDQCESFVDCFGVLSVEQHVCNGRGICNATDTCLCDNGFAGQECELNICNLISSNNASVCSGRGECKSPENCTCYDGYFGADCERYTCSGIENDEFGVCSGHGLCLSYNECECEPGYSGDDCSDFTCDGLNSTDPSVCDSGRQGACVDYNNCTCLTPLYRGHCIIPVCYGYNATDAVACSGNGDCVEENNCTCNQGYEGIECSDFRCFGELNTDTNVCSGHGECAGIDICACEPGYIGQNCSEITCYQLPQYSIDACSGNGICINVNNCSCYPGFSGANCSVEDAEDIHCFGIHFNDTNVCSGHGFCLEADNCTCNDGFSGFNCSLVESENIPAPSNNITAAVTCFGIYANDTLVCSGNGICLETDICNCNNESSGIDCSCSPGYSGANCSTYSCFSVLHDSTDVCSQHGTCDEPDYCTCHTGFKGPECSEPIKCFGVELVNSASVCSGHGVCLSDDNCQCIQSYSGFDCSVPSCYGQNASSVSVCTGKGQCVAHDTCNCNSGYTGDLCNEKICFGLNELDPLVCSGNGQCVSVDICSCDYGFSGQRCNIPVCFDVQGNSACSQHGQCIDADTCNCTSGYSGAQCEFTQCFNINETSPNVCNGNGNCVGLNSCFCSTGYAGLNCDLEYTQDSSCYGINSTDPSVCSARGYCIASNNCSCRLGYSGETCELYGCFGTPSEEPNTCSGHGICSSYNNCTCDEQYRGIECSEFDCFKLSSDDPVVCSSHGSCIAPNNCSCTSGYSGHNCSIYSCFDTVSSSTGICSGHGDCISPNQCICSSGFSGPDCSIYSCFGVPSYNAEVCSSHGNCLSPNNCNCSAGFSGQNCSQYSCFGQLSNSPDVCSQHGQCIHLNNCTCSTGFTGHDCSVFAPTPSNTTNNGTYIACFGVQSNISSVCSGHGTCVDVNNCSCTAGFTGKNCSAFSCFDTLSNNNMVCSGHGNCFAPNNCNCSAGFSGHNCSLYSCFGQLSNSPGVCTQHGQCIRLNNCSCDTGYTGYDCSVAISDPNPSNTTNNTNYNETSFACFGVQSNTSSVCSGHGACVDVNNCSCTEGYTGKNCSDFSCVLSNNTVVCSGHGNCFAPNQCKCSSGFTGQNCSEYSCFGKQFDSPDVCSGHGQCLSPDQCSCINGFSGSNCTLHQENSTSTNSTIVATCYGIRANSTSVCSGQGICVDRDKCSCYKNYVGERCDKIACPFSNNDTNRIDICDATVACNLTSCNCNSKKFIGVPCSYISWAFELTDNNTLKGTYFHRYSKLNKLETLNCSKIFSSYSLALLGNNPTCKWRNTTSGEFEIVLGTQSTLTVIDTLEVIVDAPYSGTVAPVYIYKVNSDAKVHPVAVAKTAGPYSSCSDIVVDGSRSYDPLNRTISYHWIAVDNSILSEWISNVSSSVLTIPSSKVKPGKHTISLIVKTKSSDSEVVYVSFTKLQESAPAILIRGGSVQKTTRASMFKIESKAVQEECSLNSNDLMFTWKQVSGQSLGISSVGQNLIFPADFFPATGEEQSYQFEVKLCIVGTDKCSNTSVTLVVVPQNLVASIMYSDRTVSNLVPLILDATQSQDPDKSPDQELFVWSCLRDSKPCNLNLSNTSQVTIPSGTMSPGKYTFTLTYSKLRRSAKTSVFITVVAEPKLEVGIIVPSRLIGSKEIVVYASVNGTDVKYRWSIVGTNLKLIPGQTIESTNDRRSLVILPNILASGESYVLQLDVSDSTGRNGTARTTIQIAKPPTIGSLIVRPEIGTAFMDSFLFNCTGFKSSAGGYLRYRFGYIDESVDKKPFIPITTIPVQDSFLQIPSLPMGSGEDSSLLIAVDVYDMNDATVRVTKRIIVRPPVIEAKDTIVMAREALNKQKESSSYLNSESLLTYATTIPELLSLANGSQAYHDNATEIREELLELVTSTNVTVTTDSVQQLSVSCDKLTNNPKQLSARARISATELAGSLAGYLKEYYEEDSARSVGACVSNILISMETSKSFNDSLLDFNKEVIDVVTENMLDNSRDGSEAKRVVTEAFSALVMRDSNDRIFNKQISLPVGTSDQQITTDIPSSFDSDNNETSVDATSIGVKMLVFSKPQLDSRFNSNLTTSIFSLTFVNTMSSAEIKLIDLKQPIVFTLNSLKLLNISNLNSNQSQAGVRPVCKYWDMHYKHWNDTGCLMLNYTNDGVTCSCNHTTEFASFIEFAVPKFNVLTKEDFRNIVKLNKDNMLTAIVISVMGGVYLILMTSFLVFDLVKTKYRSYKKKYGNSQLPESRAKGSFRALVSKFFFNHLYLTIFYSAYETMHFTKYQKLTVIYIAVLGLMTANAFTFGTEIGNSLQWLVAAVVSVILQTPFVLSFSIIFKKSAPIPWGKMVSCILRRKKKHVEDTNPDSENLSSDPGTPSHSFFKRRESNSPASIALAEDKKATFTVTQKIVSKLYDIRRSIYNFGDQCLDKLITNVMKTLDYMTWHGVFFLVLLTIVYCGAVVGILYALKANFHWFTYDHMLGVGLLLVYVYVAFLQINYIRLRYNNFTEGTVRVWRSHIVVLLLLVFVIVSLALVGVGLVIVIVVLTPYRHPWFIRMITVEAFIFANVVNLIILWIALSYQLAKPEDAEEEENSETNSEDTWASRRGSMLGSSLPDKPKPKKSIAAKISAWFQSPYWFPWWIVPFVYVLAVLYIAGCSYVLILYGIKFDSGTNSKSQKWLMGSGTALVQDIFIKCPIQFLVIHVVLISMLLIIDRIFFGYHKNKLKEMKKEQGKTRAVRVEKKKRQPKVHDSSEIELSNLE